MRLKYGWNLNPKGFQLAGVQAQLEGIDMIIQAATGSGKTAIAAGPHLWIEGKQSIMVCPLMTLEDEMLVKDILGLKYQINLISPEML
ncbi:hypothetical protein PHLCEN_2v1984 [Hermanssonia centrifuga]|uniref:DEAD/DEAH-box helicase domain-containing protein n=1 Tax=Hermanssonia centrifuga TaxID=98765 RepID=A0A2R6RVE6_9APHY|nr:hypothetical protein PHLCEN_2v1984 [Hermanssonia centrifuga]